MAAMSVISNESGSNSSESGVILAEFIPVQVICLLCSLLSLILLLLSKAYKDFLHRLLCYMSVSASVILISVFMPLVDSKAVRLAGSFVCIYTAVVYCLLLFWIGMYLFLLALFRVQLKKTKHEVIGMVTVLVTPLAFAWVIPWTIARDPAAGFEFKYSSTSFLIFICITYMPVLAAVVTAMLTIGVVFVHLIRGALNGANGYSLLHRKALKEAAPFLLYIFIHQAVVMVLFGSVIYMYITN